MGEDDSSGRARPESTIQIDDFGSLNIEYVHLSESNKFSVSASDLTLLTDRLVYPLDLRSLWQCESLSCNIRKVNSIADSAAVERFFSQAVTTVTKAMFKRDLFSRDYGAVNPLYVTAHWLVALLGGVATKIFDIHSIARDAGRKPFVLVESDERVPFVPTYGPIVETLFDCHIAMQRQRFMHVPMRTRVARILMKTRSTMLSFRHRLDRRANKHTLRLSKNLPDAADLIQANIRLGEPFYITGFDFRWEYRTPKRTDWVLPNILAQLGDSFFKKVKLPVSKDLFLSSLLATYEVIGGEFEGPLIEAMKETNKKKNGTLVVPALVKMPFRAEVYKAWREGMTIATEAYSDGDISGSLDLDVDLYRDSLASITFFSGLSSKLAHNWRKKSGLVPQECLGLTKSVGHSISGDFMHRKPRPSAQRKPTIMYLPNAFTGNVRLGPQRETHDICYWFFQIDLLKSLALVEDAELIYKAHPKNFIDLPIEKLEFIQKLGARFVEKPLDSTMLEGVDCLVADHFATGVVKALEHDIPVVMIDSKYRGLAPDLRRLAEQSINYIDSEANDWHAHLVGAVSENLKSIRSSRHTQFLEKAMGLGIVGHRADNVLKGILENLDIANTNDNESQ